MRYVFKKKKIIILWKLYLHTFDTYRSKFNITLFRPLHGIAIVAPVKIFKHKYG